MSKGIVSELKSISEILLLSEGYSYYIPDFQRSFVWDTVEARQLMDDFSEDTDGFSIETDELVGYLLGNIVLIKDEETNRWIVIDGQQRLTTLTLIAKALDDILTAKMNNDQEKRDSWFKLKSGLDRGYKILNDMEEVKGLRIQHDPSLSFGDYYSKLISGTPEPSDEDIDKEEDQRIFNVYDVVRRKLNDLEDEQLIRFNAYFRKKVNLIVTTSPTEAKSFQLFETLNARGQTLDPMDLIKNLFLKELSDNTIVSGNFKSEWSDAFDNVRSKKVPSSTFLMQYILAFYGKNVRASELFKWVKAGVNKDKDADVHFSKKDISKLASRMKRISQTYCDIVSGNYQSFDNDQNMYIMFKILGLKQFHPVLMMFYGAELEKKKKVLDALVRWGAAVLFSKTSTNYIEKQLPKFIEKYWEQEEINEEEAFCSFINGIEAEIEIKADETKKDVSVKNFIGSSGQLNSRPMMILTFIDLYFNGNTTIMQKPKEKGVKLTVEHILSQNLNISESDFTDLGFASDRERKDYLHRIGNLTLLYSNENASLGNKSYEKKLEFGVYVNTATNSTLTKCLVEEKKPTTKNGLDKPKVDRINKYEKQYEPSPKGHWTKQNIEKRSADLANLLYCILTDSWE